MPLKAGEPDDVIPFVKPTNGHNSLFFVIITKLISAFQINPRLASLVSCNLLAKEPFMTSVTIIYYMIWFFTEQKAPAEKFLAS